MASSSGTKKNPHIFTGTLVVLVTAVALWAVIVRMVMTAPNGDQAILGNGAAILGFGLAVVGLVMLVDWKEWREIFTPSTTREKFALLISVAGMLLGGLSLIPLVS